MIRRPPRSTLDRSSAASDVYKRQVGDGAAGEPLPLLDDLAHPGLEGGEVLGIERLLDVEVVVEAVLDLSLIHISEPTRPY